MVYTFSHVCYNIRAFHIILFGAHRVTLDGCAMIDFCCDDLVLNNDIMPALISSGFEFDIYCGTDYNEEDDCYLDVFQYFIINYSDAERLSEYTNELVYYCEPLDLYILGVTHFGTAWDGVPASWKDDDNE